jgi:hypothetical protein
MPTITSANSVFVLTIPNVFGNGVQLQGFGPDEAFDTADVDAIETQVGVDGTGVGGWLPREVEQTITLLASSPSNAVFDQWIAAQDAIQDVIYASGVIRLPSLSIQYALAQGVLRRYNTTPNARRVLQPRRQMIRWLPQPGSPAVTVSPL